MTAKWKLHFIRTFVVDSPALTTDDLLPILVYLVVKADVPNWWANLTFMKYCRFSKSSNDDEFGCVRLARNLSEALSLSKDQTVVKTSHGYMIMPFQQIGPTYFRAE